MINASKEVEFVRISNATAAGTGTITSDAVNMASAEGVAVIVAMGAVTSGAATSVKLQQSSDDGGTDAYSDLEGTSITIADTDDNKMLVLDLVKPTKQYIKAVVSRATANSAVDGIFAVKYGKRLQPVTQGSTVATTETHISPAEGTA
jgi:hypothetical protein